MAQQQRPAMVSVGDLFFQFTTEGDMLAGNYLGSQPLVWPDGKPGQQHYIDTGEGVYKFTGTFNLDSSLTMVEPGAYTEIVFMGVQPTRRGLNPVKIFRVETAKTRALPVAAAPAQPPPPMLPGFTAPGGMPQNMAAPAPDAVAVQQAPRYATPRPPLEITPEGVEIYGFTRDGYPLDIDGKLIEV